MPSYACIPPWIWKQRDSWQSYCKLWGVGMVQVTLCLGFFYVKVALKMTSLLGESWLKYYVVLTFACLSIGEGRREEGHKRIYRLTVLLQQSLMPLFVITRPPTSHTTKACLGFKLDVKQSKALCTFSEQKGPQTEPSPCRGTLVKEIPFSLISSLT